MHVLARAGTTVQRARIPGTARLLYTTANRRQASVMPALWEDA